METEAVRKIIEMQRRARRTKASRGTAVADMGKEPVCGSSVLGSRRLIFLDSMMGKCPNVYSNVRGWLYF